MPYIMSLCDIVLTPGLDDMLTAEDLAGRGDPVVECDLIDALPGNDELIAKHFATHMLNEYMQRGWCIFEAWLGYR
jgi:hypothetical protein